MRDLVDLLMWTFGKLAPMYLLMALIGALVIGGR